VWANSPLVFCADSPPDHGYLAARVEGRLELEREHTATCCTRGHPITVVRTFDDAVGVRLH
jgi:hypothetical protein